MKDLKKTISLILSLSLLLLSGCSSEDVTGDEALAPDTIGVSGDEFNFDPGTNNSLDEVSDVQSLDDTDSDSSTPVESIVSTDSSSEEIPFIPSDIWRAAFDIYEKKCNAADTLEEVRALLEDIAENDEELNADMQIVQAVFSYWDRANENDFVNSGDIPSDLPDDNSLCIVILGYSLSPNGEVRDELMTRLDAGIEAAIKYPNAYVLVTGGGTALFAPEIKEADKMAEYLIQNGIDPSRIIVENESLSTSENAVYSRRLLESSYPQISDLFIVTSDYHVPMASHIFEGWFIMTNSDLRVISNYACHPGNPTTFRIKDQVYWMEELLNFYTKEECQ